MWAFVYACCWNIHLTIILQLRVSNICLCTFNLTYLSIFVSLHVYIHWFYACMYEGCSICTVYCTIPQNHLTQIVERTLHPFRVLSTFWNTKSSFTVYADMGKPLRHLTDGWIDLLDGTFKFWKKEEVVNLESMVGVARL